MADISGGQAPSSLGMPVQLPGASNREPIPIVCRFIPYDQWFLTHLAPYWKGKHIKHHILARCLNLTYKPPDPPPAYAKNEEEQDRPPSPITFAPDPRNRPASPILFASVPPKNVLFSSEEEDDAVTVDGDWDDDDGEGMSDRPRDKGKARQIDSPDEGDDFSDENAAPMGGRVLPSKSTLISSSTTLAPKSSPSAPPPQMRSTSEDRKVVPALAHLSFTLIRFTTGQLVEDEYPLTEYDLKSHEILELHYSFASPRKSPRSGFVLAPTSNFPFPLLVPPPQLTKQKSKRKTNARLKELIASHSLRLVQLPRSIPNSEDLDYLYGRSYMVPGAAASGSNSSSSKAKQRLGPGYAQYGAGPLFPSMTVQGTEVPGEDLREHDLDASLALNFGLAGAKPKDGGYKQELLLNPGKSHHDEHRSRFEWRERWLVDTKPTHRFSLAQLHMLRDADKLIDSIENAKTYRRPSHSRPARSTRDNQSTSNISSDTRSARSPSPNSTLKGAPLHSPLQSGYGHGRHRFGKHSSKPSVVTQEDDAAYEEDDEGDGDRYRRKLSTGTVQQQPGSSSRRQHTTSTTGHQHQQHQHKHYHQHTSSSSTSHLHSHSHSHSHMNASKRADGVGSGGGGGGSASRFRPRDFTDPAVRARINPSTFIPNSKDEADLFGMKIICAKFLHPAPGERGPDPFDGWVFEDEISKEDGIPGATAGGTAATATTAGKQYTSTGPSLADVTGPVPSALAIAALPGVVELDVGGPTKDRDRHHNHHHHHPNSHRKDGATMSEKEMIQQQQRMLIRLQSKGSAPTSLSQGQKGLSMTADRRPSLPTLAGRTTGESVYGSTSTNSNFNSNNSNTNNNNGSSASLSFASFFGTSVKSSKDKEEKRREKEAKKAAKKRAERERRREKELDAHDAGAATSGSSWKLPSIGGGGGSKSRSKSKSTMAESGESRKRGVMRTPSSTVGTVDEEWVVSRTEESAAALVRRQIEAFDFSGTERNCFSDPEGATLGGGSNNNKTNNNNNVFSDRSSLSSVQDDPMSPTTSKRPGGGASASEDPDDSDDDERALPPPPPPPKEPSDHSPSSPISAGGGSNLLDLPSTTTKSESTHNSPVKVTPVGGAVPESDTDSASISISSPVFARESPTGLEEEGDSDLEFDLGLRRRRTGYRYGGGFHKAEPGTPAAAAAAVTRTPPPEEVAPAVASGSGSGKRTEDGRAGRPTPDVASDRGTIRQEYAGTSTRPVPKMERVKSDRKKNLRRGEWVIMDFGNDHAYHSLLRILHRHLEAPISTSFVPQLHRLAAQPVRPLIQTHETPPPSPPARHHHPIFDKPLPPSPVQISPNDRLAEPHSHSPLSSPLRARARSDAAFMSPSKLSKSGLYSDDENDGRLSRLSPTPHQRPRPLYASKLSTTIAAAAQDDGGFGANAIPRSLGPFPYPEWRLRAVQRAQRASLGQVHRPLELMLLAMNEKHADFFDFEEPVFPGPSRLLEAGGDRVGEDTKAVEDEDGGEGKEGRGDAQQEEREEEVQSPSGKTEEDEEVDDVLFFTDESDEESDSELEWQTWKADLGRQIRLRKESRLLGMGSPYDPRPSANDFRVGDEAEDTDGGTPTTLEAEMLTVLRKRREREPCGVISSLYTSTALPGFVAKDKEHHDNEEHRMYHRIQRYPGGPASFSAATLSSPSSSESLVPQRAPSGTHTPGGPLSNSSSVASSPQSSQAHSRGHSHSISQTLPHKSPSRSGHGHGKTHSLLHSSSMQSSLRIPTETLLAAQESPMRRPSMPSLGSTMTTTITEQTFSLNPSSFGMAIQELKGNDNVSTHSHMPTSSSYESSSYRYDLADNESNYNVSGSSYEPFVPGSPVSQHRAPSNISLASASPFGSSSNLRHQNSSFSMGRSSSASVKVGSNVLKKKPSSDRSLDTRNRKVSYSAVDTSGAASSSTGVRSSPRPKLTVATSPTSTITPGREQQSPPPLQSPLPSVGGSAGRSTSRAVLRRVKSGSSLKSGDDSPAPLPVQTSPQAGSGEAKAKKKRSGAFVKLFS
ncbi:hypothetical protein MD484_g4723, partial [Candolleomyces efflorescens]